MGRFLTKFLLIEVFLYLHDKSAPSLEKFRANYVTKNEYNFKIIAISDEN